MRVHELAKELGVTSKELLATLEQMGVAGKSASSSVPEDLVPRLRASGGRATEAPKRREVLEPAPSPRRKKQKPAPAGAAKDAPAVVETPLAEATEAPPTTTDAPAAAEVAGPGPGGPAGGGSRRPLRAGSEAHAPGRPKAG